MEDRTNQEKVATVEETANPASNTTQISYHTGGKYWSSEVGVRDSHEPAQGTPGTRHRCKTYMGGRHAPENTKPGDEGHHPPNRRTGEETDQVYPDAAADPEYKVRNNECSFSNTRYLFSRNLRLHRREKTQSSPNASIGSHNPVYKRMPVKGQYDLHDPRADGTPTTTEDDQPRGTDNQDNPSTMEGDNTTDTGTMEDATKDSGTMEHTTTNTASIEGDTTDIGTSMPPTIGIPTTSPIRQED